MQRLTEQAKAIMARNWRDGFTVPTDKLYPFQWNWDSGFAAMAFSHYDLDKGIQELQSLFSGQWQNGMLPHILFHSEAETTYFPNFDFWECWVNPGAPNKPKTSGITQPPVHGFALEHMLDQHPDSEKLKAFIKNLFPKLIAYHHFLYTHRDPHQEKLFFIYHPWESGRDNSPIWDESLERIVIEPGALPDYKRRDTSIAEADERPTQQQYDRYVYLIELGKKFQYEGPGIAAESPFLLQDCMMNAILIASNQSLLRIAERLGLDPGPLPEWIQEGRKNFQEKFWNEAIGQYATYDLRGEKLIQHREIGGLVSLFAEIPNAEISRQLAEYLQQLSDRGYLLCPSFDVESSLFDSKRYWRGPVWPHMNWLIAQGLSKYGYDALADQLKEDLLLLVDRLGFYEYYEAEKSKISQLDRGYGGAHFTWTATIILNFLEGNS